MALPKLNHLPFEIKIPSTGKGMMFRPYTVKEQKYLLMMKNETNQYEIVKLLQTLIGSCSLSETINISKLSYFDIIYIFVKLRAKSVGEIIDLKYKCNNNTNDQQCNNVVTIKLNLDEVQVNTNINNKNEFSVGNGITIKLRYPSLEAMADIEEFRKSNNIDYLIRGLAKCLEYVSDKETIYESFTSTEAEEFLNNINLEGFNELINFITNIPKLEKTLDFVCNKCGYKQNIVLDTIEDFFV